jgi:hypothetical protein
MRDFRDPGEDLLRTAAGTYIGPYVTPLSPFWLAEKVQGQSLGGFRTVESWGTRPDSATRMPTTATAATQSTERERDSSGADNRATAKVAWWSTTALCSPSTGRSTILLSVATRLAEAGKRTLLVIDECSRDFAVGLGKLAA